MSGMPARCATSTTATASSHAGASGFWQIVAIRAWPRRSRGEVGGRGVTISRQSGVTAPSISSALLKRRASGKQRRGGGQIVRLGVGDGDHAHLRAPAPRVLVKPAEIAKSRDGDVQAHEGSASPARIASATGADRDCSVLSAMSYERILPDPNAASTLSSIAAPPVWRNCCRAALRANRAASRWTGSWPSGWRHPSRQCPGRWPCLVGISHAHHRYQPMAQSPFRL